MSITKIQTTEPRYQNKKQSTTKTGAQVGAVLGASIFGYKGLRGALRVANATGNGPLKHLSLKADEAYTVEKIKDALKKTPRNISENNLFDIVKRTAFELELSNISEEPIKYADTGKLLAKAKELGANVDTTGLSKKQKGIMMGIALASVALAGAIYTGIWTLGGALVGKMKEAYNNKEDAKHQQLKEEIKNEIKEENE